MDDSSTLPPAPWRWERVIPYTAQGDTWEAGALGQPPTQEYGQALVAADGRWVLRFDGWYGSPDVYDPDSGEWRPGASGPVADLLAAAPQLLVERDEARALVRRILDLLRPHVPEDEDTAEPAVVCRAQLTWRDPLPSWAFESDR